MAKAQQEPIWKNRIVGEGEMPANQFLANRYNFRRHPATQREALRGSLNELGWIQRVVINRTTGNLIDGHARIEEALSRDEQMSVPYIEVDLSEGEEKLALAILDPMSALAMTDTEALDALLREVSTGEAGLQQMLSDLAAQNNIIPHDATPPEEFNSYDEGIETEYQCPKCAYEWSGKPR
jgi:hypothetical protein